MNKVQHFEIPADDLNRAKDFYRQAFGWKLVDYPMSNGETYAMAYTVEVDDQYMAKESNAINGGITKRSEALQHPSLFVTVPALEPALEAVKTAGGSLLTEIKAVAEMGRYAMVKDSEGNVLGVWENVKKA